MQTTTIKLIDVENKEFQPTRINIHPMGVCVQFPGFSDSIALDDHGEPILIEYRNGIPHVIIWGDINQEDPTHVINLAGASFSKRKNT